MNNNLASNNKVLICFVSYIAPLAILGKHGWQVGSIFCILFLGSYFLIPAVKRFRRQTETLDRFVIRGYSLVIGIFILIDVLSLSHSLKALMVIIAGLISIAEAKRLMQLFESQENKEN